MSRRKKSELEEMKHDCTFYLLRTNLDYYKAYDLMIKEHLENNTSIPSYIKGIKDFQKISQELAVQFKREEQMKKADREQYQIKQDLEQQILNITLDEMKLIYNTFKDKVYHNYKLSLNTVYTLKFMNQFTLKDIDQPIINAFESIMRTEQYKEIVNNS